MTNSQRLPPKGKMPPNICMKCLKIDYQRWGKEIFPKVYEGEGFNLQAVPDNLLKKVLIKMNQTAFTRMRRVTKFYSRFIDTYRHLIKICLFHNRRIKIHLVSPDRISVQVGPVFPLPREVVWEEIDEMSNEEAERRNRKLEEERPQEDIVEEPEKTSKRNRIDSSSETEQPHETDEYSDIEASSYFFLDPMSFHDRLRELTGHYKPSSLAVECVNHPSDRQLNTVAYCLQFMNIEDKYISFSMASDYGLQRISEVLDPKRLKIELHDRVIENSIVRLRAGPFKPICSFHNYQNLTHLYMSNSHNILPNLPMNVLRQLEVLHLEENGEEWNQVALQVLQMFRDGTGSIEDIAIADISPNEANSFSNVTKRTVNAYQLKPYARRNRLIKDLLDQYVADFFLVQNQITREIGVMHISYEMRFVNTQ